MALISESIDIARSNHEPQVRRLIHDYEARTPTSSVLHHQAEQVLPGGDTRTVAFHPPYPLTMVSGRGCEVVDADSNTYIDVLNNYTSLIHGHALPAITEAATRQIAKGTNFAAALESQTSLARILVDRVPSVDLIRFTNSGTEATMNMVRAARAFTGRDLILKIEGGYHGTFDDFEISVHPDPENAGPDGYPTQTVDSPGLPTGTVDSVLVTPFNDIGALERAFASHGNDIAGFILEPVMGSAGMIPAELSFLRVAREIHRPTWRVASVRRSDVVPAWIWWFSRPRWTLSPISRRLPRSSAVVFRLVHSAVAATSCRCSIPLPNDRCGNPGPSMATRSLWWQARRRWERFRKPKLNGLTDSAPI